MWKNRRSQKLDKKAILDLQSSLNSEIQAKEAINKELSLAKTKQLEAEKWGLIDWSIDLLIDLFIDWLVDLFICFLYLFILVSLINHPIVRQYLQWTTSGYLSI